MILSQKHKYLFIEIPLTASWAIRQELCTHYDGTPILHKHASYPVFRRFCGKEANDYFVFATVRHPLDRTVSHYIKLKNNHRGIFTNPKAVNELLIDYADIKKSQFIQQRDATFAEFLRAFYKSTYTDMIELSYRHLDFTMYYERLQENFAQVLQQLGLKQVRPIPVSNKTMGKKQNWQSYYEQDVYGFVKHSFGPFMRRWGYKFPEDWGDYSHSWFREVEFRLKTFVANQYLLHARYNQGFSAKAIRRLRGILTR